MKIYQINSVCGYGSTGRIVLDLHNYLLQQGNKCRIAYGRGNAPDGVDAIKITSKVDIAYHVLMTRLFDRQGLCSKRATKKLINDILKYEPDVIHLHNIHGYYLNYEMLFDFLKGYHSRVVWTLHDCWAFTGHCAYYDLVDCRRWETQCKNCPNLKEYPSTMLKGNVVDNYERKKNSFTGVRNLILVTPSQWLKRELEKSFLKEYQVEVIPNGIDTSIFKPGGVNHSAT